MPVPWVQSINPVFIIVLLGVFAAIWTKLGHRQPATLLKFAAGTMTMGLAFLLFLPFVWGGPSSTPLLALIERRCGQAGRRRATGRGTAGPCRHFLHRHCSRAAQRSAASGPGSGLPCLVEKTPTEADIRWLGSVLAWLDDGSLTWSPGEMHEATAGVEN